MKKKIIFFENIFKILLLFSNNVLFIYKQQKINFSNYLDFQKYFCIFELKEKLNINNLIEKFLWKQFKTPQNVLYVEKKSN